MVREGRRLGVAAPLNELLWRLVSAAEEHAAEEQDAVADGEWTAALAAAAASGWEPELSWLRQALAAAQE